MNKRIRTGLVSTALIAGSFLGAGVVSAQTDDTVTTDTPTVQTETDTTQTDVPADDRPADDAGGHRGRHGADRGARGEELAELLGLDVDELKAAFEAGQTVAEIAEANGVDPQTIIDAKVASVTERINTAVEEGRLTDAEAAEKLADLEERVTTRVNEGRPERGDRPGRGGPRGDSAPEAPAEEA